ncbi:hypothetical protein SH2C18_49660 [Clostridium sediminicola]|uniref:AAA family ATPase n=1 Tax=Clostridium sediminicola TaxID=3114879 RepID=UPI0031F1D43C
MNQIEHDATGKSKGEMIVFASAKGGVGKTVISVNTSVAIAQKGFTTCILDGDFQFGDVNLAMDIQPKLTISDLVQDIKSLNGNILSNYLQNHESGVKILSAPLKPEYADLITPLVIETVCNTIIKQNRYLIVDLGPGLPEHNINFLEKADKIFLVTDLEMASLKNTKLMLKTLGALELKEKTKVVVNRGDMESVIKFRDVRGILGIDDLFFISDNFKVVSKSLNIGTPFVIKKPNEKISYEINNFASQIHGGKKSRKRRKRKNNKGFFSFFNK